jgi:DNA-binding transcriptional MerR regulator
MRLEADLEMGTQEVYRAKEFATLAGVTVRALHHYDRLGLLRPKQRSQAGYRLYSMRDFARLEQIVVLKFLGIPLKQIRRLLESESNLGEMLERQHQVLSEKRCQLEKAMRAISNAQRALQSRHEPDWKLFQLIVQEIEMQNKVEWKGKYFSPEAKSKVEERQKLWSPELQEKATKDWSELYTDVEACFGEDPSGPKAQALSKRWRKLLEQFTGGDPEIQKGLNAMWADSANWPADSEAKKFVKPGVQEYMMKVFRAGK